MKLKDIADMEEYLENRCYCPHEIYDLSGFFFQLFYPDMDCMLLGSVVREGISNSFIIVENQFICIKIINNKVNDCVRIDATENNKRAILNFLTGKSDTITVDEFEEGATNKAVNNILKHANAILIR